MEADTDATSFATPILIEAEEEVASLVRVALLHADSSDRK
jgi:hypothetical protein